MFPVNSPQARDAAYNLHPYTNARALERDGPLVIERGDGIYVIDSEGKRYLEGMSGLWAASLGFSERRLADAAHRQMLALPFYHSFSGKVPRVTTDLVEKLVAIAPPPLARVLFANSGSESADAAIKLAWYYNNARGRPAKKKIIARRRAYHGVTVAAASLTGLDFVQGGFDLPIAGILHTATPHYYRGAEPGESEAAFSARLAAELDALITAEGPDTVAAFFAEPVMGAGGVIVPSEGYFEAIQAVLRRHDVLLVADEVICGFGRTGEMFGCETFGIRPDMMIVAKQLSAGYQPISALLISDALYQVIADESAVRGSFGHGHTWCGHPVPAAVALETLALYEEYAILDRVREAAPLFQTGLRRFAGHDFVGEARGIGLIGAIELVADKPGKRPFPKEAGIAPFLVRRAQEHGLILRAIGGDIVTFCPPLIIMAAEIEELFGKFARALDDTAAHILANGLAG